MLGNATIYISGALTSGDEAALAQLKCFYSKIGELCRSLSMSAYVPHESGTDPVKDPDVPPVEVYTDDMARVSEARLVIAYVGQPSLGVGAEIERARQQGTDVILLWEKGRRVSRLIRGCPAVWERIEMEDLTDGLKQLAPVLERWLQGRDPRK